MDSGEARTVYSPSTPWSIPSRRPCLDAPRSDNISALLAETRIPRRFSKTRRKSSYNSCSNSVAVEDKLRPCLFEIDSFDQPPSIDSSFTYLLTPPSSIPSLSRSCSTNSFESQLSAESSFSLPGRLNYVPRVPIDLETENPLFDIDEDTPEKPPERRQSLTSLLRPLKAVAPAIRVSSFVSMLSANLVSWANSLTTTQFDDGYGLLPSPERMYSRDASFGRRMGVAPDQQVPRPVRPSGPVTGRSTIIEAEMERAALASDPSPCPPPCATDVELQPWSSAAKSKGNAAIAVGRPREPRLNPDFLRILVLETNMRRSGKIGPGVGRARMILSPRCQQHGSSQLRQQVQFIVDSH